MSLDYPESVSNAEGRRTEALRPEASDVVLQETDITHSKDSDFVETWVGCSVGSDRDRCLVETFSKTRLHDATIAIRTKNTAVPRSIDQDTELNRSSGNTHGWKS